MRLDHRYRISAARSSDGGTVTVVMQHLKLSDPPYTLAESPGRMVDMSNREFSALVDALVALRDRIEAE